MHYEHRLGEPSTGNASKDALPCSFLHRQCVDNASNDTFPGVVERVKESSTIVRDLQRLSKLFRVFFFNFSGYALIIIKSLYFHTPRSLPT